jgi:hypothetical protein
MTRGAILVVAAAALNLTAFVAPSHAEPNGTNSAVEDNVQTIEQFRAKWNNLLDRAAKAPNVQHYCADGLCAWEWELRPRVQAKMVESNNGTHQAFYCFLAEPATTWDCYGNTLQKWGWNPPQGGDTAVAQGDDTPPYTPPAPTVTASPFSVPLIVEDGGFKTPVGLGASFYSMTVDTGATSGLVTESVATALLVRGEATEIEGGNSTIADGSTRQERRISVANVTLNGHTIHNVVFGVGTMAAACCSDRCRLVSSAASPLTLSTVCWCSDDAGVRMMTRIQRAFFTRAEFATYVASNRSTLAASTRRAAVGTG